MMMNGKKTSESAVFIAMMKPGRKASEKSDSIVSGTVVVLCNGGSIFAVLDDRRGFWKRGSDVFAMKESPSRFA